jgi:signal transduction histidine kinase
MEERVRQFGGTLQIDSSSAGTRVAVTIPLASQ